MGRFGQKVTVNNAASFIYLLLITLEGEEGEAGSNFFFQVSVVGAVVRNYALNVGKENSKGQYKCVS